MTSIWAERVLGWGLSSAVHIGALLGATCLAFYPTHWCIPGEEVTLVRLRPVRIFDGVDRQRDLIRREGWYWANYPWYGEAGDKDGLGTPSGYTFHGEEGWDRRRLGRSSESAILSGLRWLARHQDANGGWGTARVSCPCEAEIEPSEGELTALVLQAFLAEGFDAETRAIHVDPAMPEQDLPFGEIVARAQSYLRRIHDREVTGRLSVPIPVDEGPILSTQLPETAGCFNGSWNPQDGGRVGYTVRNILRLIALRKR